MILKHGRKYITKNGTVTLIKKEKWDCWFMGYAENGTFLGKYDDDGTTVEGLPELHDLVEIA